MKNFFKRIKYKTIFWFYLLTSLYSIFWHYFLQPSVGDFQGPLNLLSSFFNIYDFNLNTVISVFNDIRFIRIDFYANSILQLNTTFALLIAVACLIYKVSKFKDSRLLRFLLSISILIMTVAFVYNLIYNLSLVTSFSLYRVVLSLIFKIKSIFLFIIHYQVIKLLNKDEEDYLFTDIKNIDPSLLASKERRFMNYIIDCFSRILISFLIISVLMNLSKRGMMSDDLGGPFGEYVFRFFIVFLSVLFVYFISESLFSRSPAKFLTNTRVLYSKERKKTASIALRSIVRLIPILDSFSFLFGNKREGFHDAWSNTIVVKNKSKGIAYGWYFIIFPLVMFLTFIPKITINAVNSYQHKKVYEQYQENKLKNLKTQDLDVEKGKFIEGTNYLYHIDSSDQKNVYLSFVQKNSYLNSEPKEGDAATFNLRDYSINNYGDDLSKKLYKKIVPIQDILNGKQSVQFLLKFSSPVVSDVMLENTSWSSNQIFQKTTRYKLVFNIKNQSSLYISDYKMIERDLEVVSGRSLGKTLALEIDNENQTVENKEYKISVTIANRESAASSKYHVVFTKYGILNYYKVD